MRRHTYRCISTTLTVGEPSDKSWHKWSSTVASWPCYPSPFPERRITYSREVHGTQGHEQTEWRNINATWSQWEVDPTLEQVSNEPPLKDFLRQFFFPSVDNEIIEVQAQVLFQLSGEYQIESVLPQRAFDLIGTICDKVEKNEECGKDLLQMRRYNTQISNLFALSIKSLSTAVLPPFFRYLTEKVKSIHYGDLQPTPVEEIESTYDPRTGTAYYFTASGNQLRKMPQYEKNLKDNKNREPRWDQDCRKVYPTVSHGGYSYILLWFCPIHGHSYGFHIINGAEGPKDVFCSLLKYKEDMPQELFYDNACHLSEYCLNREPALFEDTRFWHDLFHAIAHLCGINFKSTQVEGFGGINTEICEQVNSYLQAIKYTGTHLSQDHFVFFLQFFCTC